MQYFAGKRWLPDDRVTGIGFEAGETAPKTSVDARRGFSTNRIWIETPHGFSRIQYTPMTLEEKAGQFERRVRDRHVRHGLTATSRLRVAGDLSSNQTLSSDNDGLWTAMYLAAECFRYRVTQEPDARKFARQALDALMRLESITGVSGFPARSFIKVGAEERPKDGEWHRTPDGQWEWKGDTSSDEIVGHYFAYAAYYDLLADQGERREIRSVVERITSHIVDHGYHLIDTDGKPTRWGWWAPDEIWANASETGLRALHLLSHLAVAYHITGNARYRALSDDLVTKHRYALLTRNQKINIPGHVNHSDDELAFLSYYPLLLFEKDEKLRAIYTESLQRSWLVERPERNPLWNLIYAISIGMVEGRKSQVEDHRKVQSPRSKVPSPTLKVLKSTELIDFRPLTFDFGLSTFPRPGNFDSGLSTFFQPSTFDLRPATDKAIQTLRHIPMDLITWTVTNSHRLDVAIDPNLDRFGHKQSLIALAPDERPVMKWNGNPYSLDGGNGGRSEDDGAFFLLPYWMGRYYDLIP
jgi:hypothetical protein